MADSGDNKTPKLYSVSPSTTDAKVKYMETSIDASDTSSVINVHHQQVLVSAMDLQFLSCDQMIGDSSSVVKAMEEEDTPSSDSLLEEPTTSTAEELLGPQLGTIQDRVADSSIPPKAIDISQEELDVSKNMEAEDESNSALTSGSEASLALDTARIPSGENTGEQFSREIAGNRHVMFPFPLSVSNAGSKAPHSIERWDVITFKLKTFAEKMKLKCDAPDVGRVIHLKLSNVIKSYNKSYGDWCNFEVLQQLCSAETIREFDVCTLLESMVEAALDLPIQFPEPLPLLQQGSPDTITLNQRQIHSILCNAFFCTFPKRHDMPQDSAYPDINFIGLFHDQYGRSSKSKLQKLKCFLNYFLRMSRRGQDPGGRIKFERRVLHEEIDWGNLETKLCSFTATDQGEIEGKGRGMLQVDFANKLVGGGVLGNGAVMEEIRFSICPELIASRLFTEELGDREALVMEGCEQFSQTTGYGHSFKFEKDFQDDVPLNSQTNTRRTQIVAMDALYIPRSNYMDQFKPEYVDRELVKCLSAFQKASPSSTEGIASGNWGCGAFNGDKELKAIIQILAASAAQRSLTYFTFGDTQQSHYLNRFYSNLNKSGINCSGLYKLVIAYYYQVVAPDPFGGYTGIFEFINKEISMREEKYDCQNFKEYQTMSDWDSTQL